MASSSEKQKKLITNIVSNILGNSDFNNPDSYFDKELQLNLSSQIYTDGGCIQNDNASGWIRRFNGLHQNNDFGLISDKGFVIVWADFSCVNVAAGRYCEFRHYNLDGLDFNLAGKLVINQEANRCGFLDGVKFLIPGRRRLGIWLEGSFKQPQLRYGYRRIL